MNTCRIFLGFIIAALAIAAPKGETVTAASDPFTFPVITAIKSAGKSITTPPSFACLNSLSKSSGVQFSWSFPLQPKLMKGAIVVYSAQGKSIKKIALSSNSGSMVWNGAKDNAMGVYIAKITYGAGRQTLKFFIGK